MASKQQGSSALPRKIKKETKKRSWSGKGSKKRPFEENITCLVDLVGEMTKINKAKFEVVNTACAQEAEGTKARPALWSLVKNLPGFTKGELFTAAEKLLKSPECLKLFTGLGEDGHVEYVEHILQSGT